jgi:hypothetical protein
MSNESDAIGHAAIEGATSEVGFERAVPDDDERARALRSSVDEHLYALVIDQASDKEGAPEEGDAGAARRRRAGWERVAETDSDRSREESL